MRDTGPLPPAPVHGPIFIIGAMGSGSTLLRLVLDSHDHIAIPRETGFMRGYNAHQFIPHKWSGRNWAQRMGWSRQELDAELARFYDRIFMRNVERQGKRRWGDKTPFHTWHIDDMARLFPDAVFVGIVRHPGASVGSNMTRWGQRFRQAAYHYSRYNREIARQAARLGDRFAIVRYEELVLHPEPLMRELLGWLGEPWSPHVLAHHTVQAGRGGRLTVEGRTRVDDPIDASRIAKWTTRMSDGHRAALTRRFARLGEFWGYDVDEPLALAPLREGGLVAGGHDIDARVDRFPALDLRTQGTVPLADRFYDPRAVQVRPARRRAQRPEPPAQPAKPPGRPRAPRRRRRAARSAWRRLPKRTRTRLGPAAKRIRVLIG